MKKLFTSILLSTLFFSYQSQAVPLSGGYSVPGTHTSLALFIADLNANGVTGVGPVTLKLNIDQVAPAGGYLLGSSILNGTTTAARYIYIQGNNHIITAPSGTGNHDAIFSIQGADNILIEGLNFVESSANTTATSMMEHGISIVKLNNNDGAKSISIQDCEITLNKNNTTAASGVSHYGSAGIFAGNCTYSSTAALTPTVEDGTHDNIFMLRDTIHNVNEGGYFSGNMVAADGSSFNDKNINFQQGVVSDFTHEGIYLTYFANDFVVKNIINNMDSGGTAPTANNICGVRYMNNTSIQTNTSWNCNNNRIKLTINTPSANYFAIGVMTQVYGSGNTEIKDDTIEVVSTGVSALLAGIYSQNTGGTQGIRSNLIRNFVTPTTNQQAVIGIFGGGLSQYATLGQFLNSTYPANNTIDGNVIDNFNVCSGTPAAGTSRIMAICEDNFVSGTTSTVTNNTVSNITVNNTSTRFLGYGGLWVSAFGTTRTTTITGNTFSNITMSGAGNATSVTIISPAGPYLPQGNTVLLSNNKISRITALAANLSAYSLDYALSVDINKDTISDLTNTSGNIYGVLAGAGGVGYSVLTLTVRNSSFANFKGIGTTGSTLVNGMEFRQGTVSPTTTYNINNNLLQGISNTDVNGIANGLNITAGTATYNINTNMISDIVAPSNTAAYSSSFGLNLTNTGTNNIYFNTINLVSSAGGGTGYGATGIQYAAGATNKLQNNILRVNVKAGTANNVTAMRGSSGSALAPPSTTSFGAASNIYYSPTGVNNYLYVEGTTNASLVNGFNVSGLTANSTKNIVNDTFFNSPCNRSTYHKFMQGSALTREVNTFTENNLPGSGGVFAPTGISFAESAAIDVPVSADFASAPRPSGSSDIGALEFNGGTLPNLTITIKSSTGYDTACPYNLPTLTASVSRADFPRISYQWYRDTSLLAGAKDSTLLVTPVSGSYFVTVYDSITGCRDTSEKYRMTIIAPPPALVTYYDSLTFCETSAIVLQANKGAGYLYRWMRNGVFMPGETDDHLVVDKSGDYALEVNTKLGCPTISTAIRVKVYPLPTPVIYYVTPRVLGVTNLYFTYQWYKNNVKIPAPDGEGFRLFILEDAAYTVEVTDSNGCTSKSDVYLYTLGVKEQAVAASIKIYPNPVTDRLVIESPVAVDAQLTDLAGRIIESHTDAKVMETSSLAEGMYLLTLTDKEGNLIKVEKIHKSK